MLLPVGEDAGAGGGNRQHEEEHRRGGDQPLPGARAVARGGDEGGQVGGQFAAEIRDQLFRLRQRDAALDQPVGGLAVLLPAPLRVLDLGPYPVEVAARLRGCSGLRPSGQHGVVRQPQRRPAGGILAGNQDARGKERLHQRRFRRLHGDCALRNVAQRQGPPVARRLG